MIGTGLGHPYGHWLGTRRAAGGDDWVSAGGNSAFCPSDTCTGNGAALPDAPGEAHIPRRCFHSFVSYLKPAG